jgi:hypothetical protein
MRIASGALLIAALVGPAYATPQSEGSEPQAANPPPAQATSRTQAAGTLQHRVDVLARALDLSERQKAALLGILEAQRAAVTKIWNDSSLSPAERAPATRAVEEHTADQIRAILSEQQRQHYNPRKPDSVQTPPPDLEKWMAMTRGSTQ